MRVSVFIATLILLFVVPSVVADEEDDNIGSSGIGVDNRNWADKAKQREVERINKLVQEENAEVLKNTGQVYRRIDGKQVQDPFGLPPQYTSVPLGQPHATTVRTTQPHSPE